MNKQIRNSILLVFIIIVLTIVEIDTFNGFNISHIFSSILVCLILQIILLTLSVKLNSNKVIYLCVTLILIGAGIGVILLYTFKNISIITPILESWVTGGLFGLGHFKIWETSED